MNNRPYRQEQFLNVMDRDQAERLFQAAIDQHPRSDECVPLETALSRVLAEEIIAPIDVPGFDRSNVDGYAVRSSSTTGAREDSPRELHLQNETITPGNLPEEMLSEDHARPIATGAAVPRGADAVIMVEHTDVVSGQLRMFRAVSPGNGITFAGTDIARGEVILRRGVRLTSRETGVLAALGIDQVRVFGRPVVAIISTGDELISAGESYRPGKVFDSNSRILADAVRECGGEPRIHGLVPDDANELRNTISAAMRDADALILSGGTSKGEGDLCYRVVSEVTSPGIVAHGVALKPGKPVCLAAHEGMPVVILPGFPTSAVFTFHEFVAPVIRSMAGLPRPTSSKLPATIPVRVNSEIGRTEYLLVNLVRREAEASVAAYPMGKGSGSVTAFSNADGFITIDRDQELLEANSPVEVQLLGDEVRAADLIVIGSHCPGLDRLLSQVQAAGYSTKFLALGSSAGLQAAMRGECDLAGIHLLDEASGEYNRPFMSEELELIRGYSREQGVVFRADVSQFDRLTATQIIRCARDQEDLRMVNRNAGSGTRMLLDQLLANQQPPGYSVQVASHNAVGAAISQGRADWGVAIRAVAEKYPLQFVPLAWEQFDFVVPKRRLANPAVKCLTQLLRDAAVREELMAMGFAFDQNQDTATNHP